ncbi:hypothetical protein F53441_8402 [Fusarium austroafricanum]|uniref:Uncharacterized protein n=1 Tax=Fusarium austroafricanum TaxID=2364996 RepID=A0A8H4KD01_9HYPO|nr:hypothetical protein F53441_8402 [Fusarium austroafricanum]
MHKAQLHRLSHDQLQLKYRQLCRNITREGLGACLSGILAVTLPWLLLSSIVSVFSLVNNIKVLKNLKQVMRELGFHVKKREIAKGITEGALTKLGSTIITLGHDDLISATGTVSSWLKHAGSYIAEHLSSPLPTGWTFNPQRIIDIDAAYRMSHTTLQNTTSLANWPTEEALDLTNTGTGEQKALGWSQDGGDLAKEVLVVGAVQAASSKVADILLEKPYDKVKDSSWSNRQQRRTEKQLSVVPHHRPGVTVFHITGAFIFGFFGLVAYALFFN